MISMGYCFYYIHLPRVFLSTHILYEQRIGQFSMDLLKANQQDCPRLSKGLSLRCLGMSHLPPVWWPNFRVLFLKWQFVCKFGIVEMNFAIDFLLLFTILYITLVLPFIFPLKYFTLKYFYTKYFVPSHSVDVVWTLAYFVLCKNTDYTFRMTGTYKKNADATRVYLFCHLNDTMWGTVEWVFTRGAIR